MVNQFIEYRLDISKIPKDGAVIDIFYNQDETVSPISSLVPVNRYDFVSIKDDTMYLDIQKMMRNRLRSSADSHTHVGSLYSLPKDVLVTISTKLQ